MRSESPEPAPYGLSSGPVPCFLRQAGCVVGRPGALSRSYWCSRYSREDLAGLFLCAHHCPQAPSSLAGKMLGRKVRLTEAQGEACVSRSRVSSCLMTELSTAALSGELVAFFLDPET